MTRSLIFPVLLLIFNTIQLSAQDLGARIDELLSAQFAADGPGAAALVAKDGEVIYRKAFGMADLELAVPMRPEHVFRIGSITKQFTAAAILKLAEEGKLQLSDDLTVHLPDYPTHGHTITIEHLLTHTSGIASYTSLAKWDDEVRKKDFTPEEMVDFFKNEPMDFAPGEEFRYNNSAYFLLGYIIEKVSGQSYADYIHETFFQPLGMENSYYGNTSRVIPNRAAGYQPGIGGYANADFLSMTQPYAAGSLLSTVDDLLTWYEAVMDGKVISPESLHQAHTAFLLNSGEPVEYGYGWFLQSVQGSPTFEHGGGINGFLTASIYLPEERVFVAVFSNCTCNAPGEVAGRIAGLAVGKPFEWEEIEMEAAAMEAYPGVYATPYGDRRIITLEDGKLYSQRTGGRKYRIFPYGDDRFFFEEGLTTLTFRRDQNGQVTGVEAGGRSRPVVWKLTGEKIPVREVIEVAPAVLASYAGRYELMPDFFVVVRIEDGQLIAEPTGQQPDPFYPERENFFFSKTEDVQIEFIKNAQGEVDQIIVYQGDQKYPGKRLE